MARGLGSSLKELDLSQNLLKTLPEALLLRCPKLEVFRAGVNQLTGLSDDVPLLAKCKNLHTVKLYINKQKQISKHLLGV